MSSHSIRDRQPNSNKQSPAMPARSVSAFRGSESRRDESLLGTTTESASTRENIGLQESLEKQYEKNENRYALLKIAQKYHPDSRLSACMKKVAPTQNAVSVVYDDKNRHAHYRNLMRCDNVWLCPVCSARITSRRAEEIRQGYGQAVDVLGYRVAMVTYTMSHNRYHDLKESLEAMRDARRKMRSGRKWQDFKTNYGYVGCISSLEVTWKATNGWHVHVHEIVFLDPEEAVFELHDDDRKLEQWLHKDMYPLWRDAVKKVGRETNPANGLKVDATDRYVSEYIAKHGHLPAGMTWDVALELTKSVSKRDSQGLHPFQILELSACGALEQSQRDQYRALWHEYANAFTGRRQIYWTHGLKELLQVEVIEDDSEIEETGESVYLIGRELWGAVVHLGKQADVLNKTVHWRGDNDKLNRYFRKLFAESQFQRKTIEHWKGKT